MECKCRIALALRLTLATFLLMRKALSLLLAGLFSCAAVFAQPNKVLVDKIIAVVGDKIVMQSDVDNMIADFKRNGMEVPPNAQCLSLEQLMGLKALVLQAEKDSLPISDDEVDAAIDNRLRAYLDQFGSKEEVERVAGKSIYEIREQFKPIFRDRKLAEQMRNKVVDNVKITPTEVRAFFNKIPTDSLAFYETELEVGALTFYPKASADAKQYAIEQLRDYKKQIEEGRDMAALAQLYSDEPAARQTQGRIELNRNQKNFDPTFMAKSFGLKPGQVSVPFESKFGLHIVRMESRAGDDAVVRHIIKIPIVTSIELDEAKRKLDSVRSQLIVGKLDFGTAVDRYSNDDMSKFTAGMLQGQDGTFLTIDQLDKSILPVIGNLRVGEYSQPVDFTDESGKKGVRIIYLKSKSEPHRENLADDYNKIAAKALDEKKAIVLENWFNDKIKSYYLKIDPKYSDCEVLAKWYDAAKVGK